MAAPFERSGRAGNSGLALNWPCCQFRGETVGARLSMTSQRQTMIEISDWFENNWVDLERLFVQGAILAAVVRYGRKLLVTLRASQEQVGALLKLSLSDTVAERAAPAADPEPTRQFEPPPVAVREPEPEPEPEPVFAGSFSRPSYADERKQSLGGRVIGAQAPAFSAPVQRSESPSLTPWVSAPASAPDPDRVSTQTVSIPPHPGVGSWLQAPMSSAVSPCRKV